MAPSRAGSPSVPAASSSSIYPSLASKLPSGYQHVLNSDPVPSLWELQELAKGLRIYRLTLEERAKLLQRQSKEVAASGGGSAFDPLGQPEKTRDTAYANVPSLPGTPVRQPRRQSSASRSGAAQGTSGALGSGSPVNALDSAAGLSENGPGRAAGRSRHSLRDTSTVSPAPELPAFATRPSSSSISGGRTKIKIKREGSVGLPSAGDAASITGRDLSPRPLPTTSSAAVGIDLDDEAPPSRPRRTYAKQKRKRWSVSAGTVSLSGEDSDVPMAESQEQCRDADKMRAFRQRGSGDDRALALEDGDKPLATTAVKANEPRCASSAASGTRSRHLGIRLKLNPTVAPSGIAALGAAHRPTGIHPDPDQARCKNFGRNTAASSALWALPEEAMAATIIPAAPISRPPKAYPTDPAEVDEDFTVMDWKERERERDRQELLQQTHSASASPAPGQSHLHKETPGPSSGALASAAANRARSQNLQQITYQAFQSSIDSWFKSLTEEDVAWLSRSEYDAVPFQMPPVGRHYREVWEEEDRSGGPSLYSTFDPSAISLHPQIALNGSGLGSAGNSQGSIPTTTPGFDPRQLTDEHAFGLALDEARGGPLMERLLAMVLPDARSAAAPTNTAPNSGEQTQPGSLVNGSHKLADPTGHPTANGHAQLPNGTSHPSQAAFVPPKHVPQDLAQYEERLQKELRFLDILGEDQEVDWPNRQDDEISATLRKVQSLLSRQMTINERRKLRLRDIAMDRLAYQDYASCLVNVEKLIEQGWIKRQTLLRKLISSKKKQLHYKGGVANGDTSTAARPGTPFRHGAAIAGAQSVDGSTALPETSSLMEASGAESGFFSSANTANAGGDYAPAQTTRVLSNRLPVPPLPDSLVSAMQKRRELQGAFEPMFQEMSHAKRTPTSSVYADLDLENV